VKSLLGLSYIDRAITDRLPIQWPTPFRPAKTNRFNRNLYRELNYVVNTSSHSARKCIKDLGEIKSKAGVQARKKFRKSFEKFAEAEESEPGQNLSDLGTSHTKPAADDDWSEYVRELYSIVCPVCCCSSSSDCGSSNFTANIALTRVERSRAERDGAVFNLFFSHRHLNEVGSFIQWRETRISVFLNRYVVRASQLSEVPNKDLVMERKLDTSNGQSASRSQPNTSAFWFASRLWVVSFSGFPTAA
jgi:hypothetical protein